MTTLAAAWARNGPGRVSHLVLDAADKSLCGVLRGEPASIVTCRSCLNRYATQTPQGRKTHRDAGDAAVRDLVNTATSLAVRPSTLEQLASAFEQRHDQPPSETTT